MGQGNGHLCRECDCANRVGRIVYCRAIAFHLGRVPVHRHWLFRHVVPERLRMAGICHRILKVDIDEREPISGVGLQVNLAKCTPPKLHQESQVRHAIAISYC